MILFSIEALTLRNIEPYIHKFLRALADEALLLR